MTKQGSTRRHKTTSVRGRGGGPAHEDRVLRIEDARDKYTKLRIEENKLGGKIVCAGERELIKRSALSLHLLRWTVVPIASSRHVSDFLQERGKRKTTGPGTLGVPGILTNH